MNFLRKILLIAVVAVFADNAEGMTSVNGIITALPQIIAQMHTPAHNQEQLDFNSIANNGSNIPSSYQPKIYRNPTIGAPNTACVYFTITNNGNPNNPNNPFQNAAVVNPAPANECNIYFPMDGRQPTTPEAVSWSCANIDNRPNSPITEWYMQMFGVIPFQDTGNPANDYIKAGWDNAVPNPNAQRIINYNFMCELDDNLKRLHNAYTALGVLPALPQLSGVALSALNVPHITIQNKGNLLLFVNALENSIASAIATNPVFKNNQFQIKSLKKLRLLLKQMSSDETVGEFVDKLKSEFKKNFRKIASTPVGRTLLYRILIEIRRHNMGNNVGVLENNPSITIPIAQLLTIRNSLRKLSIDFGNFVCNYSNRTIYIENSFSHTYYVVSNFSGIGPNGKYDGIVRHDAPVDVALFHEMSHWYHALRNIQRLSDEQNFAPPYKNFNSGASAARLGAYYWNLGGWANMNISQSKWGKPDYEEIRNILGVPVFAAGINPVHDTINGDDLSENLYRMCIRLPLRIGHVNNGFSFYEDSRVIDRVIVSCTSQKAYYNCVPRATGNLDFAYGDARKGLGSGEF